MVGAPDVWRRTQGEGVAVAVLDTGASEKHPDLEGAYAHAVSFAGRRASADRDGHGTHVAGIIGARKNGVGVVGVAPLCRIVSVKVLGDDGAGSFGAILRGIRWCVAHRAEFNIRILSMSLGASDAPPELRRVLFDAKRAGLITVCATGNSGPGVDVDFPARLAQEKLCIAIGSVERSGKISDFSSTGPALSKFGVVAPGGKILSSYIDAGWATQSGTSMATPHVAGLLALAVSKHEKEGGKTPLRNLDDAFEHLKRFAWDLGATGPDPVYGFGLPIFRDA
jgi:major intracellular serine protease